VGTVKNDLDQFIFQGLWDADEGEFDEESFTIGLGEKFFLRADTTSIVPGQEFQLKGRFTVKGRGASQQISESAQLKVTESVSSDPLCCKPIDADSLGLFGLVGGGRNQYGRFKLLGCFHPPSLRFWLTKTYDSPSIEIVENLKAQMSTSDQLKVSKIVKMEKRKREDEVRQQEKLEEEAEKRFHVDQQLQVLSSSSSSSSDSFSSSMKDMVKNVASVATLQSQTMNSVTVLQKRIAELEMNQQRDKLTFENSLRILYERIAQLEGSSSPVVDDSKNALFRACSTVPDSKRSVAPSQTLKSIKKPKTELTEEERKSLPAKIEALTETQMSSLVSRLKQENIFPIPSSGEFEVDLDSLSSKQLFQFHLVLRRVLKNDVPFAFANGDD
jgi:hypothetical protein